jgi:hypothetical protein
LVSHQVFLCGMIFNAMKAINNFRLGRLLCQQSLGNGSFWTWFLNRTILTSFCVPPVKKGNIGKKNSILVSIFFLFYFVIAKVKGSEQCLEGGWIGVSKKILHKLKVKCQQLSEVPTVWLGTFGSRKFRHKQPRVPTPTWILLQVQKWTLSTRFLTTPLPSG